jgi:hypothetical protein
LGRKKWTIRVRKEDQKPEFRARVSCIGAFEGLAGARIVEGCGMRMADKTLY